MQDTVTLDLIASADGLDATRTVRTRSHQRCRGDKSAYPARVTRFRLRLQITLNVQGDVTATVSIDLPNSVSLGGLPIVSRTKQANLVGTVRFSSPALRTESTSFAFLWTQTGGPVRVRKPSRTMVGGAHS